MKKSHQVLELYFINKYKQCDIASALGISRSSVNRIIMSDARYKNEKLKRKNENKAKNKKKTIEYIKRKRQLKGVDIEYEALKRNHKEASRELSGGKKSISNRAYRNWNTSIYKYNYKSKSYVLKNGITVGADVPKKIKW